MLLFGLGVPSLTFVSIFGWLDFLTFVFEKFIMNESFQFCFDFGLKSSFLFISKRVKHFCFVYHSWCHRDGYMVLCLNVFRLFALHELPDGHGYDKNHHNGDASDIRKLGCLAPNTLWAYDSSFFGGIALTVGWAEELSFTAPVISSIAKA